MKKLLLIASVFFMALGTSLAQQRTIQGTVTDSENAPLIGASIIVKGTTTGAITDIDGKYSLTVPDGDAIVVVSYTGFTTQELTLGASNVLDVTLQEGVTLETAIVTALGVQREEKALGYSVQEVGGDDIKEANTVSVIDALSGKAAGVYVNSASGAAGASSRIVLRGQTSFNGNNEALIVVDGVRLDNSEDNSERVLNGVAYSNRGMDLNPNDIASVSVLKGAAAAALYGVEGARGVVVITTKKGKAGKGVSVDFNTNYTVSQVTQLPSFQEKFSQGAAGNWYGPDGNDGIWWGGFARALSWGAAVDTLAWDGSDYKWDQNGRIVSINDPSAVRPVEIYDNVDNLYQNGTLWTGNVGISGGNENVHYRFSFGHTDQTGVVPKNTYERTNVGLRVGSELFNGKLRINGSANYASSSARRIQQGSNTSGLNLGLFRTPVTFDNTNGLSNPEDNKAAYQFPDGSQRNYRGGGGYDNPYWVVNNTPFFDNVNRMYGSLNVSYEIDQWLTLSTTLGTDFYSDNRKQEFELGSRTFPGGQVFEDQWNYKHTDLYFNITGNGRLSDDFSLSYNLGANLYNEQKKQNYVQGDGITFVDFRELANTNSVISSVDHIPQKTAAFFGSVDLGYKNFLYLTLTGRNDWISTLIVPTREFNASDIDVFYPSASLSFIFTELFELEPLSFGKLRASFAQVGGGAPNPFLTGTPWVVPNNTTTIQSLNDGWTNGILFPFQGNPGYTYMPLQGNINLVPSKTSDIELGLDLRFFNGRVGLDASYYTRNSTDQIIAINVPNTTGFQRAVVNSGELETKGAEIVLNVAPVRTPDFEWNLTFNFSKWTTKVVSLPDGVPSQYLDGFTGTQINNFAPLKDADGNVITLYEFGQIVGGAFQRVNDTDADGNPIFNPDAPYNPNGALIIDDSGSPDGTSADYNDNYGFPLADPNQQIIGNPNPDWLLGINSSLRWKRLSFNFLFDIKKGGEIWNGTKGALTFFGRTELTEDRVNVIWTDENGFVHDYANANHQFEGVLASNGQPSSIQVPLDENWYTGNGGGFGAVDEHFVEDASYYRLRMASLSYNLGGLVKGFSDLTINVTGRNLLLFTPYDGVDPETSLVGSSSNGQGLEYFQMPGTRSYSIGINAKF